MYFSGKSVKSATEYTLQLQIVMSTFPYTLTLNVIFFSDFEDSDKAQKRVFDYIGNPAAVSEQVLFTRRSLCSS